MALDFPANPTNGQVYDSYVYNSTVGAWQSREDSRTVAILSSTVPASANPGDIWVNTNDGISFVYYDDGTSAQWMELLPSGVPLLDIKADLTGGNAFTGAQTITSNATTQIPLIVNGVSSQTADLQQWKNSGGSVLAEVDSAGIITAPRFISTQATGTAPMTVSSTTVVANLNADLLDGQHASVYSPAGMVSQFAGATAPTGWLLCDGSSKLVADYPALHAAIGYTYGGSGLNFNVPDLQGRVPVGPSGSTGRITSNNTLSATGGVESVTLSESQIPSHTHTTPNHSHTFSGTTSTGGSHTHTIYGALINRGTGTQFRELTESSNPSQNNVASAAAGDHSHTYSGTTSNASPTTNATGGGQSHTNLQPYIVMNYIIKT